MTRVKKLYCPIHDRWFNPAKGLCPECEKSEKIAIREANVESFQYPPATLHIWDVDERDSSFRQINTFMELDADEAYRRIRLFRMINIISMILLTMFIVLMLFISP
ncbi:MAG: hypothetical protein ACTSSJ_07530 [Candidatus Odinarchaeia archaeon]